MPGRARLPPSRSQRGTTWLPRTCSIAAVRPPLAASHRPIEEQCEAASGCIRAAGSRAQSFLYITSDCKSLRTLGWSLALPMASPKVPRSGFVPTAD